MKILVTGANGFVGKNLVVALKQIKNNNNIRPNLEIDEIYEFDIDKNDEDLDFYTKKCDFVFNLAGINKPKDNDYSNNYIFLNKVLSFLKLNNNNCPIMLSSSIHASLDENSNSLYGKSKLEAEKKLFDYSEKNNVKVLVYRFPNLFGKWCKPNYNSVVSTFCYNYAHDLPVQVENSNTILNLVYIDDLICEMLDALEGKEHRNGLFCETPISYQVSLERIVEILTAIKDQSKSISIMEMKNSSFEKKLYSTYLSYLPKDKTICNLKENVDDRGSFTELFKSNATGQISVNISKPGKIKGQHFHNFKWEVFIVVKGEALIQEKNISTNEIYEFHVSGKKMQAVYMLPGFAHNIINISDKEDLITIMWASEQFNKDSTDTYYEKI